jgi:hypothetical protein
MRTVKDLKAHLKATKKKFNYGKLNKRELLGLYAKAQRAEECFDTRPPAPAAAAVRAAPAARAASNTLTHAQFANKLAEFVDKSIKDPDWEVPYDLLHEQERALVTAIKSKIDGMTMSTAHLKHAVDRVEEKYLTEAERKELKNKLDSEKAAAARNVTSFSGASAGAVVNTLTVKRRK